MKKAPPLLNFKAKKSSRITQLLFLLQRNLFVLTGHSTMLTEVTGGSKLTEFVSDHVFSNENLSKSFAVVNIEGVTNKVRTDQRTT